MSVVDIQWSQVALDFEERPAVRLTFEVLLDPDDETGVIVIEARTFPARNLVSLLSTSPISFPLLDDRIREAGRVFTELVREHSAPF